MPPLPRLVILLCFAPLLSAAEKPVLRAGAAAVDITPRAFPLNMPGGHSANLARGAHDPLHSRALVLDDGSTQVALVVVDNLGVSPEVIAEAKTIASAKTGIATSTMLISSTHTHSGPSSSPRTGSPGEIGYRQIILEGIAESIVAAHAARRPAAAGAAAHPLPDEVFNRRWYLKPGTMPLNPYGRLDIVKMNPGARTGSAAWSQASGTTGG
jgi:hypothetical protein